MAIGPLRHVRRVDERCGLAALIDVETTGLSRNHDEVVELAVILFAFDRETGQIRGIVDEYDGLRDPKRPIPREATAVHGIRDGDVRGKRLNDQRVLGLMNRAEFVVAHNASFDRAFVERLYPEMKGKYWACSMNGVPWKAHGFASRGLQNLIRDHKIASKRAHRGANDARATLALLAREDFNGTCYFQHLMERFEEHSPHVATNPVTSVKKISLFRSLVTFPFRLLWWIIKAPFVLIWWLLRLPVRLVTWPFRHLRGKTISSGT